MIQKILINSSYLSIPDQVWVSVRPLLNKHRKLIEARRFVLQVPLSHLKVCEYTHIHDRQRMKKK